MLSDDQMKKNDIFKPRRSDFILIAILAAAAALLAVLFAFGKGHEQGTYAEVVLNGQSYGIYDLKEDQTIRIETDLGYNMIEIQNGSVSMKEADCPDLYCVSKGAVSSSADPIVCLPHRLVIQILPDKTEPVSFDAVSE